MMQAPAIALKEIAFTWPGSITPALQLDELILPAGEQIFVAGPSGSGKSTLLALIGGILVPEKGESRVLGIDMKAVSSRARDRFRVDHIGFIFQQFNLISYLSILENVLLPCRFSRLRYQGATEQAGSPEAAACRLLEALDLPDSLWARPVTALSVGQQQRVAAARALIGKPRLIVADEPTSALDAAHQDGFLELLKTECVRYQSALVFVSHDQRLASRFNHYLELKAGRKEGSA